MAPKLGRDDPQGEYLEAHARDPGDEHRHLGLREAIGLECSRGFHWSL